MKYPLLHISQILKGQYSGSDPGKIIEHIQTDSRDISFPSNSLFIAIKGDRFDGHQFVDECQKMGLNSFIIEENTQIAQNPSSNYILVPDSLEAMQTLAAYHRAQFKYPVVAITGSNGKTTVKEWLYQLLHQKYNVIKSPRSYNSQIGVPLSLLMMDNAHEIGIFEAGISKQNEMLRLARMINCDIGIFTNLGNAHDAGFESREQKLEEKLLLFENVNTIIYSTDDDEIHRAIQEKYTHKQLLNWSLKKSEEAFFHIDHVTKATQHKLIFHYNGKEFELDIPFSEDIHIQNLIHCVICALELGLPLSILQKHCLELRVLPMRLEMKAGERDCILINDSYNADLSSLHSALQFTRQHNPSNPVRIILSDLLETGQNPDQLYTQVARILTDHKVTQISSIGEDIRALSEIMKLGDRRLKHYASTEEFLESADWKKFSEETILIKGARKFRLERVFDILSKKTHSTYLEIDLSSMAHNLRVYSQFLQPGVKMMVMMKASAYGSGAVRLARFLETQKVDYFAVAFTDEGIELRQAGIQLPILVLNPEVSDYPSLIRYRLEAEISNIHQLNSLQKFLSGSHEQIRIHLKLESGMHRLGLEYGDLGEIESILKNSKEIKVVSIFSHLSAADDASQDAFSLSQIKEFDAFSNQLINILGYKVLRHILNSPGISRLKEFQMDMVRLGIGMYGIDPSGILETELEKVHSLRTRVAQIKTLQAGDYVGYSNRFKAKGETRIATLRIGYADGLPRLAGNEHYRVWMHGKFAPIIGNVCMDLCMVNITQIKDVNIGDEVEIFGKFSAIEKLAHAAQTIPYEILTNISPRVKRVFIQE